MKIYSIPDLYENISDDFDVFANNEKIGVYSCRVSAYPLNQVWPGYQRPIEQTEKSSFVMLGSDDEMVMVVKAKKHFESVTVRPTAKNIKKIIKDETVELTFPGPGQYSIEFDNKHNVLTVFINPEKEFDEKKQNEIIYFGPGVHQLEDKIKLENNQTVFIDEGAIVFGGIFAQGKKNISVIGYGILDCSKMQRASDIQSLSAEEICASKNAGNPIFFANCRNINIEGITIVDAAEWSVRFDGCENINVDNIKLIGMWRYNADGCDFCNCLNAIIKNSYLRNFDDCIVVKGLKFNGELPVENIIAENCVIWCDWGKALEIGAETCAPYMRNICFNNCYIIHGTIIMMDIAQGDRAKISDVKFEKIYVEYSGEESIPSIQTHVEEKYQNEGKNFVPSLFRITAGVTMWSSDSYAGNIKNVSVTNININADALINPEIRISRSDNTTKIDNITIEDVYLNDKEYHAQVIRK